MDNSCAPCSRGYELLLKLEKEEQKSGGLMRDKMTETEFKTTPL
jgi:hypothetical protein